jgi:hypothetical protein
VLFAVGKRRVDIRRHSQHIARHVLFGIVIAGEIALNVAEGALDSQPGPESSHHLDNVHIGRQYLQVFGRPWRRACLPAPASLSDQLAGSESQGTE